MDVDFGFNEIKSDNNMNTYFLCFKKLLRIAEIFLILVFFSWMSTRLPFAVKISGEYFRHIVSLILTPLFIFLLGNFIVLTLFFKSRHLKFSTNETTQVDFDYFVGEEEIGSPVIPVDVVYHDKETILEESAKVVKCKNAVNCSSSSSSSSSSSVKVHKRSQSVNLRKIDKCEETKKQLRRSETEKIRRVTAEEKEEEEEEVVDQMSNEEFQRAIEEFIAKQVKFHQEEKLAIVLHTTL